MIVALSKKLKTQNIYEQQISQLKQLLDANEQSKLELNKHIEGLSHQMLV